MEFPVEAMKKIFNKTFMEKLINEIKDESILLSDKSDKILNIIDKDYESDTTLIDKLDNDNTIIKINTEEICLPPEEYKSEHDKIRNTATNLVNTFHLFLNLDQNPKIVKFFWSDWITGQQTLACKLAKDLQIKQQQQKSQSKFRVIEFTEFANPILTYLGDWPNEGKNLIAFFLKVFLELDSDDTFKKCLNNYKESLEPEFLKNSFDSLEFRTLINEEEIIALVDENNYSITDYDIKEFLNNKNYTKDKENFFIYLFLSAKFTISLRKKLWDNVSKKYAEFNNPDYDVYSIIVLPKTTTENIMDKTLFKVELPNMKCNKIAILLLESNIQNTNRDIYSEENLLANASSTFLRNILNLTAEKLATFTGNLIEKSMKLSQTLGNRNAMERNDDQVKIHMLVSKHDTFDIEPITEETHLEFHEFKENDTIEKIKTYFKKHYKKSESGGSNIFKYKKKYVNKNKKTFRIKKTHNRYTKKQNKRKRLRKSLRKNLKKSKKI